MESVVNCNMLLHALSHNHKLICQLSVSRCVCCIFDKYSSRDWRLEGNESSVALVNIVGVFADPRSSGFVSGQNRFDRTTPAGWVTADGMIVVHGVKQACSVNWEWDVNPAITTLVNCKLCSFCYVFSLLFVFGGFTWFQHCVIYYCFHLHWFLRLIFNRITQKALNRFWSNLVREV